MVDKENDLAEHSLVNKFCHKGRVVRPFFIFCTHQMETCIANWGVELAFLRTKVGAEFEVANVLEANLSNTSCQCFGTYGYFDLAAVRCFDRLNTPYLVLLHHDIAESAPFRFFADQNNPPKDRFEQDLASWPGAILILAKIHAAVTRRNDGSARWVAADLVRKKFPQAHVLFGFGYSELLLVAGGDDLAVLLGEVSQLRQLRDPENSTQPLFFKTTTFPLLSCTQVHKTRAYELLKGKVLPVITASCEPAVERQVATELQDQGMFVYNVYGKSDLLIGWKDPIAIADLANFLTRFRQKWGATGTLSKTSTYLESRLQVLPGETSDPDSSSFKHSSAVASVPLPGLMTEEEENRLFEKLRTVEPHSLRAALSDLTLRLMACLNDPQIGEHYLDMANTFAFLPDLIDGLRKVSAADAARYTAEAVVDLARAAINQRYAGLELHPETLAHSHVPLLCDIRTIVAAATCTPYFIFDNLRPDTRASETWTGFVLFGGTSAPQYLHQDILALPPSSLFRPIEEWWKITHEAAHGVFRALRVFEKLPDKYRAYIEEGVRESGWDSYFLIDELFANWFDWKYIFKRDTEFFLQHVWASWVRVPRVQMSKSQYLARSFAVFICPRLSEFIELFQNRWMERGLPWLKARWEEFVIMLRAVPGMPIYIESVTSEEKQATLNLVFYTSHILSFFENGFEQACGIEKLSERLNPAYPEVDEHIRLLKEGRVIAIPIKNPCRLHLELLKSLNNQPPSLAMEIAFLFSLENTYLKTRH